MVVCVVCFTQYYYEEAPESWIAYRRFWCCGVRTPDLLVAKFGLPDGA